MSNLKSKAEAIKEAGEAQRGNFEPRGVPKRVYSYWLNNSESRTARHVRYGQRENFCHFWRVVVIWAPLLALHIRLVRIADWFISTAPVWITALVLGFIGAVSVLIATNTLLNFLGCAAIVLGTFVGLLGVGLGFSYLEHRFWNDDWNRLLGKIVFWVFAGLAVGAAAAALTLGTISVGWIFPVLVVSIGIAVIAIFYGIYKVVVYLEAIEHVHSLTEEECLADRNAQRKSPFSGKVAKFFSGIGDFIILFAQIVRVNKWKICPIVQIDEIK